MISLRTLAASVSRMTSSGGSSSAFPSKMPLFTSSTLWRNMSTSKTFSFPLVSPQSLHTQSYPAQKSLLQSVLRSTGIFPPAQHQRDFHLLSQVPKKSLLPLTDSTLEGKEVTRSVVKFSLKKGRRQTVKTVIRRFYRLDWGIWIHAKSGRGRHLWKKGKLQKKRARQHVFCNAWHTRTLERMTAKYWHKKKYWVDDPYESYHSRPDYWVTKNTKNIVHQLD